MDAKVKLPIGIESFEKIRRGGFYYTREGGRTVGSGRVATIIE